MFKPIIKNLIEVPNLSLIVVPKWIFGSYALYLLITAFSWANLFLVLAGYFVFMILGITIGYHRYFCHKSFTANTLIEKILLYSGTLAGQGSVIMWTAVHRGYHHRKADTLEDPHSPIHGIWHSFILWMFRLDGNYISPRYAVEFSRNKEMLFIHNHYAKIFWIFNLVLLSIDPALFLYFSMLPALITLNSYGLTNSITHIRRLGYQNYSTKDNSVNVPWAFPLVLGECWHNNHHGKPGASYFGEKWWELDPAGWVINLIGKSKNKN